MEVELSLVLDVKGDYRLILEKGTNFEIDEYTSKNFEDSSQIRKKYQKQIDEFLSKYKTQIENSNKPNYAGRIAIVIPNKLDKGINRYQRKVLYKKHIVTFDNCIKSQAIMKRFSEYEKKKNGEVLVPAYFHSKVRSPWTRKYGVRTYINEFLRNEKQKRTNYYEIIRDMMIVYENEEFYTLPTIDEVYENYKLEKLRRKFKNRNNLKLEKKPLQIVESSVKVVESTEETREPVEETKKTKEETTKPVEEIIYSEEKMYTVNGDKYTLDEIHLFDLEDFKEEQDTDFFPDGVKRDEKKR